MRKLVCTYAAPCCKPEKWARPPPASVVIGNGGRVAFGDFSITFDGTDTGKRFADGRAPWLVSWETAVGTGRPATAYQEIARFDTYSAAIRKAKEQENLRLDRLGAR